MSEHEHRSAAQPFYAPPAATLTEPQKPQRVGPARTLLASVAGFALDVGATEVLSSLLILLWYLLVPDTQFVPMNFGDWTTSLAQPSATLHLLLCTSMSMLGGYVAARIARERAWTAFALMAVLHLVYPLVPDPSPWSEDIRGFIEIGLFNLAATASGVWLRWRVWRRQRLDNEAGTGGVVGA